MKISFQMNQKIQMNLQKKVKKIKYIRMILQPLTLKKEIKEKSDKYKLLRMELIGLKKYFRKK